MRKIALFVVFVMTSKFIQAQKNERYFNNTLSYVFSSKRLEIKPFVDCFSVDTCFVEYKAERLAFVKLSNGNARQVFFNDRRIDIISMFNDIEQLEIDSNEFPDYTNSIFLFNKIKKTFIIVSSIPNCTGLSCKYRLIQVIDLINLKCYEKKVKWDR
jgi:hypothetical protein